MASARDHATAALLEDAAARARRYLGTLDDRGVAPTAEAIAALTRLDEPLPDGPTDAADVLARLDELVSPATKTSPLPVSTATAEIRSAPSPPR